jgi:peptidoglycan-associated lipoprotein
MRVSIARFTTVAAVVIGLGAFGCASKPKETTQTSETGSEWKDAPSTSDSSGMAGGKKLDLQAIYFDFDRSEIRADQRESMRANGTKINGMSGNITIEGHTDERGSEEYNLALGERRATSIQRYLADLGVSSSRLSTVSFGESRPAVQGHDESAWRYNRRGEFVGN